MRRNITKALLASSIAIGLGLGVGKVAHAQTEIKIGVIYPLTGPGAAVGAELRSALEMAADIIKPLLTHPSDSVRRGAEYNMRKVARALKPPAC